jgi:hypothetical protein
MATGPTSRSRAVKTLWKCSLTGTAEPSYGMSETLFVGGKGISQDTATSYATKYDRSEYSKSTTGEFDLRELLFADVS